MSWKASMIIIQNPDNLQEDELILHALNMSERKYNYTTTLDECIYPRDESINIGYYNSCVIICDDFQLTGRFIMDDACNEEEALAKLFPDSEILALSCLNLTNFHGYCLMKNGKRVRTKAISSDDGFYVNMGEPIEEEMELYSQSQLCQGKRFWAYDDMPDYEFTEDQMLEEFTFGVAKHLLGVYMNESESEKLWREIPFKKYSKYF